MIAKALNAVLAGLVAGFITLIILFIVSVVLPGVSINATMWAGIIGLLVGLIRFFSGGVPTV